MTRLPSRILLSGLLLLAAAGVARADTAHCLVRSIIARPVEGGVANDLSDLKVQLTRPPFTTWKSFSLLASHPLELNQGASGSFPLPEGREGSLTYKDHLKPENGKHRVRLHLEVKKQGKLELSTVLVLDEGGTVLSAGQRSGDGMLILAVSCSEH